MAVEDNQPPDFRLRLSVTMVPGPDDLPPNSPEMQAEFWDVAHALQARGLKVTSRVFVRDALGGGMTNLGQLTIDLIHELNPVVVAAVSAVLGTWAHARFGRTLRLKVGDVEVEAQTLEKIEKLLSLAARHRASGK